MSFQRLDANDFIISADSISSTLWSNYVPTLNTFFTSSTQEAGSSGNYYLSVYQTASTDASAAVQFDISYGNLYGSGSEFFNNAVTGSSYTRTVYGQYRNLVLGDENSLFNFGGVTASDFYVINVERARYKEKLFLGSINLVLKTPNTGSTHQNTLYLTDNSADTSVVSFNDAGRVYQIVSGSNGRAFSGTGYTTNSGSYGLFLPDVGLILLNPAALDISRAGGNLQGINLNTSRSFDSNGYNYRRLLTAIQSGSSFGLNSEETISSDYVFVRTRNYEFNYSENPSFISGSTGEVLYDSFINNPQTYITTVGMYNDNNDLVAVAKLSRPILKDFTKETLIRVKLDF
jgi:hypothetical protein